MDDQIYLSREPMLEMYIFESNQLLEQMEEILLLSEKENCISVGNINEIFRIMHTIKGSSAMMMFNNISSVAHAVEDLFYFIRENKPGNIDYSAVCDIVLAALDFIKGETEKIEAGRDTDGNEQDLTERIKDFLSKMRGNGNAVDSSSGNLSEFPEPVTNSCENNLNLPVQKYVAKVQFDEGCRMENIRAYTLIHNLKDFCVELHHLPENIIEDNSCSEDIAQNGFHIFFSTNQNEEEIRKIFSSSLFVSSYDLRAVDSFPSEVDEMKEEAKTSGALEENADLSNEGPTGSQKMARNTNRAAKQSLISVNINKLDVLMDLVGEIVITESMVTRSPDLAGLQLENFEKAARQLRKLTDELQDIVMSIRMIPIAATFHKMHRIVRDMGKKLNKEAELVIFGEETEVDKNIIDHLGDPLMHLVRNAMDHGLETTADRIRLGKSEKGRIVLEAKSSGGDVWITVKDDGRGLDKNKILERAREHGLLNKPESDYTEKEIYSFVLLPGFSTKENVSEFSGRGVGMDVVRENIDKIGGTMMIDSSFGTGTVVSIKIPLTLAIIDGMQISVGESSYIIPTTVIRKSFRADDQQVIEDAEGNEIMMIRGDCYPVIRIHKKFGVTQKAERLEEGIIVMVETDNRTICLFADELLGEQQVVVKPIPSYLKKVRGLAGCTILGDGSISLIIDANGMEP